MTVRELIRKLKIFGKNKFVVVGNKNVVGIDWNDEGDVELFVEEKEKWFPLEAVLRHIKEAGGKILYSQLLRAPRLGVSTVDLRRAIKILAKEGFVRIFQKEPKGTVYILIEEGKETLF